MLFRNRINCLGGIIDKRKKGRTTYWFASLSSFLRRNLGTALEPGVSLPSQCMKIIYKNDSAVFYRQILCDIIWNRIYPTISSEDTNIRGNGFTPPSYSVRRKGVIKNRYESFSKKCQPLYITYPESLWWFRYPKEAAVNLPLRTMSN